jgi:DNA-binding transcriptional MerR regulator/methylmalonyl-CoA mutase cobalamin-binding subunit
MKTIIQLSITDMEQETGISRDTLRMWERRYGFPNPLRNERHERVYDGKQLERLRLIKQLLDRGMQPGKLAKLEFKQLRQLTLPDKVTTSISADVAELLNILVNQPHQALLPRLEALLQQHGLMSFLIDIVTPLNHAIGEAWFTGKIGILDEHHYVEQVKMVLTTVLRNMPQRVGCSKVLLTTLPGEQHSLGLLMVACALQLTGAEVLMLGVQTPLDEIVRGVVCGKCNVVGISCSEYMGQRTIAAQLFKLRKLLPDSVAVWAGGSGVAGASAMPAGVRLFHDLREIPTALAR